MMRQVVLPIFGRGVNLISEQLGFEERDGKVTYFNGVMPVFCHAKDDLQSFRMITSQFCTNGNCTQQQVKKAFGVPLSTIKRYCTLYRKQGPKGFYAPRRYRGAPVLTRPVLAQAQELLDQDMPDEDVANKLGIKIDTFKKSIRAGKLHARKKKISMTE
jgi:hypothetical protein